LARAGRWRHRRLCSGHVARLLVVHHTPSPAMQAMLESALAGARTDEIEGVDVVVVPALTASAGDVLAADGYLLGTPVRSVLVTRCRTVLRLTPGSRPV